MKWQQLSTKWKAMAILIPWAIVVGYAAYRTLIAGTTAGPDFIRAIQVGTVAADAVSSIEVVEPPVGDTPFTAKEYDNLSRRATIDSKPSVNRMVSLLLDCQPGNIQQNHPATTYRAYLKINTKGGFYWLYCNLSQDGSGSVLRLDANNCNATNPNGAKAYDLANFSELLTMLGRTNSASPGGPANRSQPIRAERPIAGAKSVRSPLQLALDIIGNTAFFGLIAWLYIRARRKSPRFEKPDVIYQEWSASGASQRNILTKVLGARNCLRLVVTWDFLWVTSWFPFSIFCPLYDLEHVIPLHSIVSVRNAGFYGSRSLLVTFSDEKGHSHALMLRPKNPAIFAKSLGVQIETESKSKQSATVKGSIPEN